jgi:hypothetical protein
VCVFCVLLRDRGGEGVRRTVDVSALGVYSLSCWFSTENIHASIAALHKMATAMALWERMALSLGGSKIAKCARRGGLPVSLISR